MAFLCPSRVGQSVAKRKKRGKFLSNYFIVIFCTLNQPSVKRKTNIKCFFK